MQLSDTRAVLAQQRQRDPRKARGVTWPSHPGSGGPLLGTANSCTRGGERQGKSKGKSNKRGRYNEFETELSRTKLDRKSPLALHAAGAPRVSCDCLSHPRPRPTGPNPVLPQDSEVAGLSQRYKRQLHQLGMILASFNS